MRHLLPCLLLIFAPIAQAGSIFQSNPKFPSGAAAQSEEDRWVGQLGIGYQASTGNTRNSQFNGRALMGYKSGPWRHTINVVGNRTTDAVATTAERFVVAGKSDYRFNETDYLFITAQYEDDRFAGFDRRTSQAAGYGRHLYENGRHRLSGEIGGGFRQVRFVDRTRDHEAIARIAANWLFAVSDNTEFSSRLIVETGSDNTFTESITALKTNLIGSVFSSLSYTIKRNSQVPVGRQNEDTFTAIQIEYRF